MSEAKKALEVAIQKIGKAYGELLRVAEKHGDDISKEDYQKARYYLTSTIDKLWDKIDVVRDIAKATNGEFSLDSVEMPETTRITWVPDYISRGERPVVGPMPDHVRLKLQESQSDPATMNGKSLAKEIGGRLTKKARDEMAALRAKQSVNLDLEGDDIDDLPDDMTEADRLLADVDFIDG